jgi:hypothetical protein
MPVSDIDLKDAIILCKNLNISTIEQAIEIFKKYCPIDKLPSHAVSLLQQHVFIKEKL